MKDDGRGEKNRHWGSTLKDFLPEEGIYETTKVEAMAQ
jgi:hypothetical protein